jgi:hypothetical protein
VCECVCVCKVRDKHRVNRHGAKNHPEWKMQAQGTRVRTLNAIVQELGG